MEALASTHAQPTEAMGNRLARRIRTILVASSLAVAVAGTITVGQAAAATNDPRIAADSVRCYSYPTGTITTLQPFVLGTRSSNETIYWQPILQRYTNSGWVNVAISPDWITFTANKVSGSYQSYFPNYKSYQFTNLASGYYYRIAHLIFWGSTGEYGTAPENKLPYCQV